MEITCSNNWPGILIETIVIYKLNYQYSELNGNYVIVFSISAADNGKNIVYRFAFL